MIRTTITALVLAIAAPVLAAPPIPLDAARQAVAAQKAVAPEVAHQRRFIWCPSGTPQEHAAAILTVNTAVSQSNVDVRPTVLAGGQLLAIDLRLCAPDDEAYERLVSLWASLSDREPYFHVREQVRVTCAPYVARDGRSYTFRNERRAVAAPHLFEHGAELEALCGNVLPHEQSLCPVVRVDWFVKELLSTADGGRYYDFRGLKIGDDLEAYLVKRGASQEQAKRLDSDEKAAMISRVTGKARGVTMFPMSGTRLSVGPGIAAVTNDPFDDTTDPQFDPFRELLDAKTNGHEVMVTLASGWIEYTLFDGNGKLVDEAPANLVTDHNTPAPFTARLQGPISCIRCHAAQDQWKPFENEVALMLADRVDVLGDANSPLGQHETLRRLAGLYSGDLSGVLVLARDAFDRRAFATTGMGAAEAAKATSDVYTAHEQEHVTTLDALREIGFEPDPGDALGTATWRRVMRPSAPADPILARFGVDYLDVESGRRVGLKNTRRSWEGTYADAMSAALPALIESRKAAK